MTDMDFSLDGISALTKHFETTNIYVPPLPDIDEEITSIPRIPGVITENEKLSRKPINVKGILRGTSHSNLLARMSDFSEYLYSGSNKKFARYGLTDRYYWVKCTRPMPEPAVLVNFAMYEIFFTCNDPFAYDNTPDTDDRTITIKDDAYIIANGGHYWAYPVITVTFNQPQNHIYIQNNGIDGNRFDISKAFIINDELEVDCKNGTVKLNGSNNPVGFGDGGEGCLDFIILSKGNNEIQVGTDDETINIDVNFNFRKAYLY